MPALGPLGADRIARRVDVAFPLLWAKAFNARPPCAACAACVAAADDGRELQNGRVRECDRPGVLRTTKELIAVLVDDRRQVRAVADRGARNFGRQSDFDAVGERLT